MHPQGNEPLVELLEADLSLKGEFKRWLEEQRWTYLTREVEARNPAGHLGWAVVHHDGGEAVVCPDDQRLLRLHEVRERRGVSELGVLHAAAGV